MDLRTAVRLQEFVSPKGFAVPDDKDVDPLEVVPVEVLPEERVLELEPKDPVDVEPVTLDPEFELLDPVPELARVDLSPRVTPVLVVAVVALDAEAEGLVEEALLDMAVLVQAQSQKSVHAHYARQKRHKT